MRNTFLQQLPGVQRCFLYYIIVPVLLLCLLVGAACPVYADESADSSSSTTSDTTDADLSLGGDITDAYDKYGGGVDSGLDDVKDQYDGIIDDCGGNSAACCGRSCACTCGNRRRRTGRSLDASACHAHAGPRSDRRPNNLGQAAQRLHPYRGAFTGNSRGAVLHSAAYLVEVKTW